MQEIHFDEKLEHIRAKDGRFSRDAYHFMREALEFTQKQIGRENHGRVRHVSVNELLDGLRQYALQQFGPMTITVLEAWGVRSCGDFVDIIFNMVEVELLARTDQDNREDFQGGYDFVEAFDKPFWPKGKNRAGTRTTILPQ